MSTTRHKAKVYEMKPNLDKIVEAILHVIHDSVRRRRPVTQYDIVKTLFLADRAHLNDYGRPVTFDMYSAMKHGPVPSAAYDFLKEKQNVIRRYGRALPWSRRPAPEVSRKSFIYYAPTREIDEDILSPSDLDVLSDALVTVQSLGFGQIRKLTHEDAAYVDAWEDQGDANSSYSMSYALLFDVPNDERARDLSFLSRHI